MKGDLFLTGGTGFIGRHLAARLLGEGYRVTCLVRETSDASCLKGLGVRLAYGDVLNKKSLEGPLREAEAVFHLAASISVAQSLRDPSTTFSVNAVGTLNLLEALRLSHNGDCLVIYPSSDRVYGNPTSEVVVESHPSSPLEPYALSKLCGEMLCQSYSHAYSIPFVILRGGHVYGPGQGGELLLPSILRQVLSQGDTVALGNLDTFRNFVYVEDMVEAFYLALLRPQARNRVFNIAERSAKVAEVVDILLELCSKYLNKRFRAIPDASLARPQRVETRRYELDCSQAREVLSWVPRYTLERGLEETLKFALARKGNLACEKEAK